MRVKDGAGHRARMLLVNREELTVETAVETGDQSLVQQHFADEVDINTIVRRFGVSRIQPFGQVAGVYGDFTGIEDYESAVAAVERANAGFLALPADVRDRFQNNPGALIEFASRIDPEKLDEELFGKPAPEAAIAAAGGAPGAPVGGTGTPVPGGSAAPAAGAAAAAPAASAAK